MPLLSVPLQATDMNHNAGDEALREYVVRVKWIKTSPRQAAYREKGLFSQQNTVCKLKNDFTLQKLAAHFHLDDEEEALSSV